MTTPKKIFLVIGSGSFPGGSSSMFRNDIVSALQNLGYLVEMLQFDKVLKTVKSSEDSKAILQEVILQKYHDTGPHDYFLSFLSSQQVNGELFDIIKRSSFTINWTCNLHQFEELHKDIACHVDLNTYATLKHKDMYDSINANSCWMPFGANPNNYSKYLTNSKQQDFSFIGTAYGQRPYYILRLLQSNIPIKIFGYGWKKNSFIRHFLKGILPLWASPFLKHNLRNRIFDIVRRDDYIRKIVSMQNDIKVLSDDEFMYTISSSRMSLNFPESRFNHDVNDPRIFHCMNLRDFEIPMGGSMLITQYSKELEHFYIDGEEVVSFKNEEEMIDLCNFYLNNQRSVSQISQMGYERAVANHTWENRFSELFNSIT